MRIIIESAEQTGITSPIANQSLPTPVATMDGGGPSETLLQAVAETLPASMAREGMDGGSPQSWLVEAIESAAASPSGSSSDTDAGGAPSGE